MTQLIPVLGIGDVPIYTDRQLGLNCRLYEALDRHRLNDNDGGESLNREYIRVLKRAFPNMQYIESVQGNAVYFVHFRGNPVIVVISNDEMDCDWAATNADFIKERWGIEL